MKSHLVEIQRRALQARNAGHLEAAADLFKAIVREEPGWEHGSAVFALGGCYDDLGNFASAEQGYRKALQYEPRNPIFLGGLASFLYLHGDPAESFDWHLALLDAHRENGNKNSAESTEVALKALRKRMGFCDDVIAERLNS